MPGDLYAKLAAEPPRAALTPLVSGAAAPAVDAVPAMLALPCTLCVVEAKQAMARKADKIPEPLPGAVMLQGNLLCEIRHTLNVGAPGLIVAQPGQMPTGGLG